jgi:hypothetical protein
LHYGLSQGIRHSRTFELLSAIQKHQSVTCPSLRKVVVPRCLCSPDICQLLVDSLLLQLTRSGIPKVGNELHQAAHVRIAATGAAKKAGRRRRHSVVGGRLDVVVSPIRTRLMSGSTTSTTSHGSMVLRVLKKGSIANCSRNTWKRARSECGYGDDVWSTKHVRGCRSSGGWFGGLQERTTSGSWLEL